MAEISLKKICLECITNSFERFNNAYLSSEDVVLLRNLEFLRRVYSSEIIHTLRGKRLLNDRHLEFLINERLQEFDLSIFLNSGCSLEAIEKRIVLVGHGFLKVTFDTCGEWKNDILRRHEKFIDLTIRHLSNVEILHILHLCNDTTLINISLFCTKLKELNIGGSSNITNKGLEWLCKKCGEHKTECLIKILSVENIPESAIRFLLRNMPSLEVLNCNNLPAILHSMHKEDLKNNTLNNVKKYNLTKLDFINSTFQFMLADSKKPDILRVWTEVCPNIKTLYISFSTEKCVDLVSRFSNLEDLTVHCVIDTGIEQRMEFNNFFTSNGIKLRNLHIHGFFLSIPVLIDSCQNLEKLALGNIQFQSLKYLTKEQSSIKSSLKSLNELNLEDINFSNEHAEDSINTILLSSPHIEKLFFKNCEFENSEINNKLIKFYEKNTLQHLAFNFCNIDVALLQSIILKCSSLVSLSITSCTNISSDDVYNLYQTKDTTNSLVELYYDNRDPLYGYYTPISDDDDDIADDYYSEYYKNQALDEQRAFGHFSMDQSNGELDHQGVDCPLSVYHNNGILDDHAVSCPLSTELNNGVLDDHGVGGSFSEDHNNGVLDNHEVDCPLSVYHNSGIIDPVNCPLSVYHNNEVLDDHGNNDVADDYPDDYTYFMYDD